MIGILLVLDVLMKMHVIMIQMQQFQMKIVNIQRKIIIAMENVLQKLIV